ncbi:hydrogenase maturation nickel metallochaperone HypA [bacterium]|nr:MAG: hydrogenase maturation nickel metallochaperone HypA [bacterium]
MHEMGIAAEISKIALEEAKREGAGRIASISISVGRWSGVEPETLRFALGVIGESTIMGGCGVEIILVEPTFSCDECQKDYTAESRLDPCPGCGSLAASMVAGDELSINSLEVE